MDIGYVLIMLVLGNSRSLTQPNLTPSHNQSNGHAEHMGESSRFAHFSCVPTEHGLVNVGLQMPVAHVVVTSSYHPAEVAPKTLD